MQLLPDPSALRRQADGLSAWAVQLRVRAARLVDATESAHWTSTSARRFRTHTEELAHDLTRAAGEVDDAAGALRAHADAVTEALAALTAPARGVLGLAHAVLG